MKMVIFAVRDVPSATFGRPFFTSSVVAAKRAFSMDVNSDQAGNQLSEFPSDFELLELGEFDDQTGRMVLLDVPVSHGTAASYVRRAEAA